MKNDTKNEKTEYTKSTEKLKEGIVSLSAMLNKYGEGTLYFNIPDGCGKSKQETEDTALKDISEAIRDNIKPQIAPVLSIEHAGEKSTVRIFAQGSDIPYSAYGQYYMRVGNKNVEISPDDLRSLIYFREDTILKTESPNQALSFRQLKMLYAIADLEINEETYKQDLHLLTEEGEYNLMAYLLSDHNSFSIKVAKFRGTDKTELVMRNEYGFKCLLTAIGQVLDYMKAINETYVKIDGGLRKERKLFSNEVFRKAWLFACLYNRWTMQTPPAVYIFSDRIEIISAGGLPANCSPDDFYAGKSRPLNSKLQQIMAQLDYIKETENFIPLIMDTYGKKAFDISDNFISVILPLENADSIFRK